MTHRRLQNKLLAATLTFLRKGARARTMPGGRARLFVLAFGVTLQLAGCSRGIPDEARALVFQMSDFSKPVTLNLPCPTHPRERGAIEQWARGAAASGGLDAIPPIGNLAVANAIHTNEIAFLKARGFAKVDELQVSGTYGQQTYYFLRYDDSIRPHVVEGDVEPGKCVEGFSGPGLRLRVATRVLEEITYSNRYDAEVFGVKVPVIALTFTYKLLPDFKDLHASKVFEGKAQVARDPNDGRWKLAALSLSDRGAIEVLASAIAAQKTEKRPQPAEPAAPPSMSSPAGERKPEAIRKVYLSDSAIQGRVVSILSLEPLSGGKVGTTTARDICWVQPFEVDTSRTYQTQVLPSAPLGFCENSLNTALRTDVTLLSVSKKNLSFDHLRSYLSTTYTPTALVLFEDTGPDTSAASEYYALIATRQTMQPVDKMITRLQEDVRGVEVRRYFQLKMSTIAQPPKTAMLLTYACDTPATLMTLYNAIGKEAMSRDAARLIIGTEVQRADRMTVLVDVPIRVVISGCRSLEEKGVHRR